MAPEGVDIMLDYRQMSPAQIMDAAKQLIQDCKVVYDSVGEVKQADVNYDNVIVQLLEVQREGYKRGVVIEVAGMVALSQEVRDAASEAEKLMDEFSVEMAMRKDIFDNLVAFSKTEAASKLKDEEKRFLSKMITEGKRNGLNLSEDQRDKVKKIKKRISELGVNFNKNLNEDTSHIYLTREELLGVPEDLLNSLDKNDEGKLKVTMKYPHFFPVSRKCKNPDTRYKVEKMFSSRCKDVNTKIIEEMINLRQDQADILGYPNHAAYIQEVRMAKNPETVKTFLGDLGVKLQPLWEVERQKMMGMKEEQCKELGIDYDGKLNYWDFRFLQSLVEEKQYAVDQEKLKEYFPMEVVTKGLLEIYQKLLGLQFIKLEGMEVWHEDVEVYKVEDKSSGQVMGYFYLDLYPRDGKYGHACMVQLQQGCLNKAGERQKSVVAMICNFSKSTADKPSLLDHKEVETYFHEFGHVMHGICSQSDTSKFFGTHVERDFVEAPSQMLENWVWQEESLRMMSGHYKDGSELPKEMLDKLIQSKKANAGIFNLRQILLASYDQKLHSGERNLDTAAEWSNMHEKMFQVPMIPDTNFAATFGHLVGYDGQYYGYMWSEVYCEDMFATRFEKEGVMNEATGLDYRNKILRPGGAKDGNDLLKDFLGRAPNDEAFLRSKGLNKVDTA